MKILLTFLLLFIVKSAAGSVIQTDVTKTVVFIYKGADGTLAQADGTGFILTMRFPNDPKHAWVYLVTARHVVHTDSNNFKSPLFDQIWIRLNKKGGGSLMRKIAVRPSGPEQSVFFNADAAVDVAVLTLTQEDLPDLGSFDIKFLPVDMLTDEKDFTSLHIGVGTDMFFTGMFTGFVGEKKSYPIVRFGKLAMIPEEKVTFAGLSTEAYLMEAFSFGGNSGSPVFFFPSSDNTPGMITIGGSQLKIAGLMRGFFGDLQQIQFLQSQTGAGQPIPVSSGNTGIALIVPAKFIKEILQSPALELKRSGDLINTSGTH